MLHPCRGDSLLREDIERLYGVFLPELLKRQIGTGGSMARWLLRSGTWATYAEEALEKHSEQMLMGSMKGARWQVSNDGVSWRDAPTSLSGEDIIGHYPYARQVV